MARPETFVCACGKEAPQSRRGGIRTRCPACEEKHKSKYQSSYYVNVILPKRKARAQG